MRVSPPTPSEAPCGRASNRTVNLDVGALRRVLKRFKHWHRLEDDVKMLTESGGAPIGRVLTDDEQERLLEVARGNPKSAHVYCAAVLAANTSLAIHMKRAPREESVQRAHANAPQSLSTRDSTPTSMLMVRFPMTRTFELYLIALTGYAGADIREGCLAAGFDAHPVKPGEIALLEKLLGRERG